MQTIKYRVWDKKEKRFLPLTTLPVKGENMPVKNIYVGQDGSIIQVEEDLVNDTAKVRVIRQEDVEIVMCTGVHITPKGNFLSPKAVENLVAQTRQETVREVIEKYIQPRIQKHKPTHNSCCTCQECGMDFDGCLCDTNNKYEKLAKELRSEYGIKNE